MRRFFGLSKEPPKPAGPAPSLSDTSAKIEIQVKSLEEKILKTDDEIRQLVARGPQDSTAKQRALQAMKRKKLYEQQRDQLLGTQFNVESLAFQQEQAEMTMIAVEAMKAGQESLRQQQQRININAVDGLLDDINELRDEMNAINDALAQGSSTEADAEAEEEFLRLQEEQAAMKLAGFAEPAPTPAVGPAETVPAAPVEAAPAPLQATAPAPVLVPSAPPA